MERHTEMLELRTIRRRDFRKIYRMTAKGMHFEWYTDSRFFQHLYARYFFSMELNRATRVYAAYANGRFVGALLADMLGEAPCSPCTLRQCFVWVLERLQTFVAGKGGDEYDAANRRLLAGFCEHHRPDGEITFLAADPDCGVKGVGTFLLEALEKDESGKLVYLYTDDACNYGFYEHRGFALMESEKILLDFRDRQVPLKCMLYAKRLGE